MTSQEEIKRQSSTGIKSTDVDPLCLNIDVYLQDVNPPFSYISLHVHVTRVPTLKPWK